MKKALDTPIFPFSAIVGQEQMKLALILNVVYPAIGGVLVRGERGTAKSTVVRGLANLLPPIRVIKNCPFQCRPHDRETMCPYCLEKVRQGEKLESILRRRQVVNLPIGITEDRLLGTIDLETAIHEGRRRFEPGLLAEANRAFLYIDEVNLLSDHIVDLLLDVSAMGINRVEREGISFAHHCNLILVGSMNPEEGDLRPQLLDRFGLCVEVDGLKSLNERSEVIRRRLEFEKDPAGFMKIYEPMEQDLVLSLESARKRLPKVVVSEKVLELAGRLSLSMKVEGHRSDLTIVKAARAMAALESQDSVSEKHVIQAAEMALRHRVRQRSLSDAKFDRRKIEKVLEKIEEREVGAAPPPVGEQKKKNSLR